MIQALLWNIIIWNINQRGNWNKSSFYKNFSTLRTFWRFPGDYFNVCRNENKTLSLTSWRSFNIFFFNLLISKKFWNWNQRFTIASRQYRSQELLTPRRETMKDNDIVRTKNKQRRLLSTAVGEECQLLVLENKPREIVIP